MSALHKLAQMFDNEHFESGHHFRGRITYYARYNQISNIYSVLTKIEASLRMLSSTMIEQSKRDAFKTLRPSERTIYREYIPKFGGGGIHTVQWNSFKRLPPKSLVKLGSCKFFSTAKAVRSALQDCQIAHHGSSKAWLLAFGEQLCVCGVNECRLAGGNPFAGSADIVRKFVETSNDAAKPEHKKPVLTMVPDKA